MKEFYPFYMTYGSPLFLQGDTVWEQEFDRLRGDYPQAARQVQVLVERECDQLDYEGSWLYDEHPDKWTIYRLGQKIRRQLETQQVLGRTEKMQPESRQMAGMTETQQLSEQKTPEVSAAGGDFLEELIEVLLFHEISRRRCRRRRCYYPGGRF